MSDGGFLSFLCVIVIVGGIFGGFYLMREKAKARGYTYIQLTLIGLVLTSFLLSFQSAFVQMGTEHEIKVHKQRVELQRAREAEKMKDLPSVYQIYRAENKVDYKQYTAYEKPSDAILNGIEPPKPKKSGFSLSRFFKEKITEPISDFFSSISL